MGYAVALIWPLVLTPKTPGPRRTPYSKNWLWGSLDGEPKPDEETHIVSASSSHPSQRRRGRHYTPT